MTESKERKKGSEMEEISGYDEWKTQPGDEAKPECYCEGCGCALYAGDVLYTIDGGICEDCLNDEYKEVL